MLKSVIKILKKTLASLLIVLMAAATCPSSAWSFSISEEKELGEKLLYTVRASFPIIEDPDLHQYLTDIGREVLEVAGIQYFDYHFHIVKSNQFNAFAAPSGLIFFYTNLIEAMNTEDELVSVLAHEIGHVVRRHIASRYRKGTVINIASLGAALAALALGGGALTSGLFATSMAAGQSAQLYFSRQDEMEADLLAYKWLRDLDRDTEGQKRMLQTMRRITRYRSEQVPQYLLTHPDPEARLDYVESLIAADNDYQPSADDMKEFDFLRFKYRIMSLEDNTAPFKAFLAGKMSDERTDEFQRIMAMYGLSQIDLRENNYRRSLTRLETVMKAFPDEWILEIDQANTLAAQGNLQEAEKILAAVYRANPTDLYVMFSLGKVYGKREKYDEALVLFAEVEKNFAEFSALYFEMGRILSKQGKSVESRFYLGKYNLYEGKLKLAEANFKQTAVKAKEGSSVKQESQEMLDLIERLQKK